jgi:hypothetical protein
MVTRLQYEAAKRQPDFGKDRAPTIRERLIRRSGRRFADKIMRHFKTLARDPRIKFTPSAQA